MNSRNRRDKQVQCEGPNWLLIAGGALLSTLSVRLVCKLKQSCSSKHGNDPALHLKGGSGRSFERRRSSSVNSNLYSFSQVDDCFNCISGNGIMTEMKQSNHDNSLSDPEISLPLVTVPPSQFSKDQTAAWISSPDRIDLPPRPFHHSNSSESPCVSESGSDAYNKREVVQKLRQQLKRRDDMILEMQDRISDLQSSLNTQLSLSSSLQKQLEASNTELLSSEKEIHRLRKAIADHCMIQTDIDDSFPAAAWTSDAPKNGLLRSSVKIEMLKKEVADLKDVVEGKEFLLQNYKEQKNELSSKLKEMQQRLDSQLPHIL